MFSVCCRRAPFTTSFFLRLEPLQSIRTRSVLTARRSLHGLVSAVHQPSVEQLYQDATTREGAVVSSSGALMVRSGEKTGRSPRDKRIVLEESSQADVWWGPVNIATDRKSFQEKRKAALALLKSREKTYVVDGYAGWDHNYRIKIRVLCSRAYHALFMRNMLVRPTEEEFKNFGEPDFTIYNAGQHPATPIDSTESITAVQIDLGAREMVILGTEYAGEMKKGVFSVMHYLQPVKYGNLSLHSSANEGRDGDVTLFFGLSGTGKTTLSADPERYLIGDDEHLWTDTGVVNIEGGSYPKCARLSRDHEPEIFDAIRHGAILENVAFDPDTRIPDYADVSLTENSRCAFPLDHIPGAKNPALSTSQPSNIIYLCCDAFGVLPPVSLLTSDQAQYWFLSGYTSRMPATEQGVIDPTPTFSACFGAPFLILQPSRYASMLADRMSKTGAKCWLINTGWLGGGFGVGERCSLKTTRAILNAIHDGSLSQGGFSDSVFGLSIPSGGVSGVEDAMLDPRRAWGDDAAYEKQSKKLAGLFVEAFKEYADDCSAEVVAAGPQVLERDEGA